MSKGGGGEDLSLRWVGSISACDKADSNVGVNLKFLRSSSILYQADELGRYLPANAGAVGHGGCVQEQHDGQAHGCQRHHILSWQSCSGQFGYTAAHQAVHRAV